MHEVLLWVAAVWFLLLPVLGLTPIAVFVVPALVAGRAGRSLRASLRTTAWTVTATIPLTYAVRPPEAQRHAVDGRTWTVKWWAPVGVNLSDALFFALGAFPLLCLTTRSCYQPALTLYRHHYEPNRQMARVSCVRAVAEASVCSWQIDPVQAS